MLTDRQPAPFVRPEHFHTSGLDKGRDFLLAQEGLSLPLCRAGPFASDSFMVVAEDLRAPRMAEDGSVDADLPDCDCDVSRQASSSLGIVLELCGVHGIGARLLHPECFPADVK